MTMSTTLSATEIEPADQLRDTAELILIDQTRAFGSSRTSFTR
jgi:hypothetical protein